MLTFLQTSSSSNIDLLSWIKQGLGLLVIGIYFGFFLYVRLFSLLKSFFRRSTNEIGILTINILPTPLLIIFVLTALKALIDSLDLLENLSFIDKILTAGIVAVSTYLINQLFPDVISYYFSKYAEKTEADWDDVLVPLIQKTAPIIIYLIGSFFVLQTLGIDLSGLWVTLGGMTFVIGFALRDILSNFFSGLVLLIDTPFQFGDVLALQDDYVEKLWKWIEQRFQTYALWQSPKIWMQNLDGGGTVNMAVKFFVDNIKLEQCQRGNRIRSDVHGEVIRRLRQAYIIR